MLNSLLYVSLLQWILVQCQVLDCRYPRSHLLRLYFPQRVRSRESRVSRTGRTIEFSVKCNCTFEKPKICRSLKHCRAVVGSLAAQPSPRVKCPPMSTRFNASSKIRTHQKITSSTLNLQPNMASFFDLKARKEAAATNSSSKSAPAAKETNRMQPWVEK